MGADNPAQFCQIPLLPHSCLDALHNIDIVVLIDENGLGLDFRQVMVLHIHTCKMQTTKDTKCGCVFHKDT